MENSIIKQYNSYTSEKDRKEFANLILMETIARLRYGKPKYMADYLECIARLNFAGYYTNELLNVKETDNITGELKTLIKGLTDNEMPKDKNGNNRSEFVSMDGSFMKALLRKTRIPMVMESYTKEDLSLYIQMDLSRAMYSLGMKIGSMTLYYLGGNKPINK